jgi:putative ABC transport system permease protein
MLFRKMLRDMRRQKMQFVSILLMAFLGLFLYSGLAGQWYGTETYLQRYNKETNLGDVWVYSDNFTDQDMEAVSKLEGITAAQRRLRLTATGVSEYSPAVCLYFLEKNEMNLPLVAEGSGIDLSDTESIWLDIRFAEASGLSVGDFYTVKIGEIPMKKRIAGLCYSSELIFYQSASSLRPDYREIGFGFLSIDGFPLRGYLIDRIRSEDTDPIEMLDTMLSEEYTTLIESMVDNRYEDMVDAMVEDDYEGLIEDMVRENYDQIISTLVEENRDSIVDRYVRENYDTLIDEKVEADYDQILDDYVRENYDSILAEYVTQNRGALIDAYVRANYDSLLDQYVRENRDALIRSYVALNFDMLADQYAEQNDLAILDSQIYAVYTPEQIEAAGGMNMVRQAVIDSYGGLDAFKQSVKAALTQGDLVDGLSASMTDAEIRALVAQQFTVEAAKKQVSASLSNKDLIAMAKKQYSVRDLTKLVKDNYSVEDVKELAREKYSPEDLIGTINDEYSNEDLEEIIRENYSADALKEMIMDEYDKEDVKQLIRDNYPPEEMKRKLLAEYTADDIRELILEQYPGDELRDLMVERIMDMDESELKDNLIFNELLLKTARTDLSALESDLSGALENGVTRLLDRSRVSGVSSLPERLESQKTISDIFPTAFIAIAILTIITTMSRMVAGQRTQIGTLKALGFSKRRIMRHYLGYGFFASTVGAFLGVIAGPQTLPYLLYSGMSRMYSLPEWKSVIAPYFWLVAAACALACTLATFLSVRSVLSETPAQSLRPKTSEKLNMVKTGDGKLWRRLSFSIQWNLRDIFRSKVRSVMGIVGAMSSMALLITAFSLQDSFNDTMRWIYGDIQHYNTQIVLARDTDLESAETLANQLGGQLMMNATVEIKMGPEVETAPLTVVENTQLYSITDEDHRPLELREGDVAVSRKLSKQLGLEKGSSFIWRLNDEDEWITSSVAVIHVSPMSQGIVMTRSTLAALGVDFTPRSIISGNTIEPFDNEIVSAVHSGEDLEAAWSNSMESLTRITLILMAAAILLSVVVLYNLGLLSFTEKERELATLKVLGFKSAAMRRLLLMQNLWFSVLGMLLGIPLGNWLNGQIVTMLGDGYDLVAVYSTLSLAICASFVLFISVSTNLIFSKRLKTLNMVAAFKSID